MSIPEGEQSIPEGAQIPEGVLEIPGGAPIPEGPPVPTPAGGLVSIPEAAQVPACEGSAPSGTPPPEQPPPPSRRPAAPSQGTWRYLSLPTHQQNKLPRRCRLAPSPPLPLPFISLPHYPHAPTPRYNRLTPPPPLPLSLRGGPPHPLHRPLLRAPSPPPAPPPPPPEIQRVSLRASGFSPDTLPLWRHGRKLRACVSRRPLRASESNMYIHIPNMRMYL